MDDSPSFGALEEFDEELQPPVPILQETKHRQPSFDHYSNHV